MSQTDNQEVVYLVEDDADGRLATQLLLELSGWRVLTYTRAEDFIAALPQAVPGCLLVDYRMPGMSGLQLFLHLRELGLQWPTIMISGHAEPPLIDSAISAGVAAFLLKPVISSELRKCLREQFELLRQAKPQSGRD